MLSEADVIENPPHQNWSMDRLQALYDLPLNDLIYQAHGVHRAHFNPNQIQLSTLMNIKTGGCPEDCAYCPQSAHHNTGLEAEKLIDVANVKAQAEQAKAQGATRFCMGAAWRAPKDRDIEKVIELVEVVKDLGMESCLTLGMLTEDQVSQLEAAGLDYYNHNLDTSREYYEEIITTRDYDDRLKTLSHVSESSIKVCSGGIIGMGEAIEHRMGLLSQLANMDPQPESVPINQLVRVEGTPLASEQALDPFDMVRMIAVARIAMPESYIRLSAGRTEMNEQTQALCFFSGANSIFYGEKLLTTDNPQLKQDQQLLNKLGLIVA